jgi:hypothetical protein
VILVLGAFCVAVAVVALAAFPFWGVVIALAVRPIVDATWQYSIGGFNLLDVLGAAFPLFLLPRVLNRHAFLPMSRGMRYAALGFFLCQVLGAITLLGERNLVLFAEVCMRALNGYLGFFVLILLVQDRRTFRIALLALLLAGVFPVVVGLYQNATGVVWQERMTVGLTRRVGLYHDAFNLRWYGFQALAAVLLYRSYFKPRAVHWNALLNLYAVSWLYVIFHTYSKAATLILVLWWIMWTVLRRDWPVLAWGTVALSVLCITPSSPVLRTVETMFSKEIAFGRGDIVDSRRLLAGRGYIWEARWDDWTALEPEQKLVGTGRSPGTHNEFFRILFAGGIAGLLINVLVLAGVGYLLLRLTYSHRSPLNVIALMVFTMWLIDCVGVHPGLYPAYQWFVWGIITLAVCRLPFIEEFEYSIVESDSGYFGPGPFTEEGFGV